MRARSFAVSLIAVACGSSSTNDTSNADGGNTGGAGGTDGSTVDGSSGATGLDASDDATDANACTCEHQPYVAQDAPCGPPDGPGTTCFDVGKTPCYRCTDTCGASFPDAGPTNCTLVVGVGSVVSDPTHSWWCCT